MPYMKVSLTKALSEAERTALAEDLGAALENIPGKSREMLMADIEDGKNIYVSGKKQDNFAFIDARYFSNFEYHIKKKFAKAVFEAVRKNLGTAYENMSMTVSEFSTWAGFGDFVDERYSEETEK